jgi:hypothetical protein
MMVISRISNIFKASLDQKFNRINRSAVPAKTITLCEDLNEVKLCMVSSKFCSESPKIIQN